MIPENLSTLSILQACLTGRIKTYAPVVAAPVKEDGRIENVVLNACKLKWEVPDERVSAAVKNGWVTLEGEMEWLYQSEAAANAVKNLEGVKGVYNHITIKARLPELADIRR